MRAKPLLTMTMAAGLAACATAPEPGALYGRMGDADVAQASRALQSALESLPEGESRSWVNPATGTAGRITPTATTVTPGGVFCRDYREELTVGGETGRFQRRACRNPQGQWVWVE